MGVSVGVDFGTSNTAAALPGPRPDAPARVVAVDPRSDDPRLLRSVLFFPETSTEVLAGAEAIGRYLEEGDGRFLQSLKSFLPSTTFDRTTIRRRAHALPDLVAAILAPLRARIEEAAGAPVTRAVFGRPAVFSPEPEQDLLAEHRLAQAARLAGFPEPVFLPEPIAAALAYEERLDRDEVVLVGDFGAGTSDFTLMRLGPSRRERSDRRADVIASSGVRIAGDRFDAAIVEHKLLRRFGAGATYSPQGRRVPVPGWMFRKLLAWHELALLRTRENLEFLRKVARTADDARGVKNLIQLVEENLAYHLYRAVEAAKRTLGTADVATVSFHEGDIDFDAKVTRVEFDRWTAPLRAELSAAVDRVLSVAPGTEPDAVFLTGGTSKIPSVRGMLEERFGRGRIVEGDAFTSVAAGLGRAAASL